MKDFWHAVSLEISRSTGTTFEFQGAHPIGGGCIHDAHELRSSGGRYFVKRNAETFRDAFEVEAEALKAMASTKTIRVPSPICQGCTNGYAWLALEFLEMGSAGPSSSWQLGQGLARFHQIRGERFGWHRDNWIGGTPQRNPWTEDWVEFYGTHRLGFQFDLARQRGLGLNEAAEVMERLPEWFEDYSPRPSLLHGDLWSGNYGFDANGLPVVFDPASYYGDREAEFGIITMFGGFDRKFYEGYGSVWPLDEGFERRLPLYRLYHELNHFNLFGGGYGESARASLIDLLNG